MTLPASGLAVASGLAASNGLVELGVLIRPHGVRGAVLFRPHNADSTTLARCRQVYLGPATTPSRVRSARPTPKGWLLEIEGHDTREASEALVGTLLHVAAKDLPPPDPDEFYYSDVIGAPVVTVSGAVIGRVTEVTVTSTDVFVIARESGGELWVPVVPVYVVDIEKAPARVVVVDDVVELCDFS